MRMVEPMQRGGGPKRENLQWAHGLAGPALYCQLVAEFGSTLKQP